MQLPTAFPFRKETLKGKPTTEIEQFIQGDEEGISRLYGIHSDSWERQKIDLERKRSKTFEIGNLTPRFYKSYRHVHLSVVGRCECGRRGLATQIRKVNAFGLGNIKEPPFPCEG